MTISKFNLFCRRILVAAILMTSLPVLNALAQDFVPGAEDLPLMDGLTVQDEGAVVFDSPSGRVVETYATGLMEREDVLAFYKETLPELGWHMTGKGQYAREEESLTLDFSEQDEFLVVRFTLAPQ